MFSGVIRPNTNLYTFERNTGRWRARRVQNEIPANGQRNAYTGSFFYVKFTN